MDKFPRNKSLPRLTTQSSIDFYKIYLNNTKLLLNQTRQSSSTFRERLSTQQSDTKQETFSQNNHLLTSKDLSSSKKITTNPDESPAKIYTLRKNNGVIRTRFELSPNKLREKSNTYVLNLAEKVSELKCMLFEYANGENITLLPKRPHINKVIECLEMLTGDENAQKELMTLILKVLKSTIYVNPEVAEEFKIGTSFLEDNDLKNILKTCEESEIPYYTLCFFAFKELAKQHMRTVQIKRDYEVKIKDLKEEIKEHERKMEDMIRKIAKCVEFDVFENVLQEKDHIFNQWQKIYEENNTLKSQQKQYEETIKELDLRIEKGAKETKEYTERISEVEEINEVLNRDIEDYKKLVDEGREKTKNYKNMMDTVIVKLADLKQQISTLMKTNNELSLENQKLKLRAATAFDHLTPRPNYRKLQKERKVELDIYDSANKVQIVPTAKVLEELLDKVLKADFEKPADNFIYAEGNLKEGKNIEEKKGEDQTKGVVEIALFERENRNESDGKLMPNFDANKSVETENSIKFDKSIKAKDILMRKAQSLSPNFDPENEFNITGISYFKEICLDIPEIDRIEESDFVQDIGMPALQLRFNKSNDEKARIPTRVRNNSVTFKSKKDSDQDSKSFGRRALRETEEIMKKVLETKKAI